VSLRHLRDRVAAGAVSHPLLSRLAGRLADLKPPPAVLRPLLRAYVRLYGVDMAEAAEPLEAYPSFNAFFTRRLKPGRRPLPAEPGVLVSPADSRLTSVGPVPDHGELEQVKGRTYALSELLGSVEEAACFRGGVQATLYLSPSMYHRVHSPLDGRVRAWTYRPGRLFPVNAFSVRSVDRLFTRNERVVVFLDSDAFGPVALVMVGAANVGRMTLSFAPLATNTGAPAGTVRPPQEILLRRGDELGAFNLGSTVVLLAADGRLEPLARPGDLVRVNQPLFRRT
jgi:phosphatidylserine decarboxylase